MSYRTGRTRYDVWVYLALAALLTLLPGGAVRVLRGHALSALQPLLSVSGAGERPATLSTPAAFSNTNPSAGRDAVPAASQPTATAFLELQAQIARLREQNNALVRQIEAIGGKAGALSDAPPPGVWARLIARREVFGDALLGLEAGTQDGVREGAGVLYRGAAVGRVVSAGPRACSIAPVTHPGLRVAARLVNARAEGLLAGIPGENSAPRCVLEVYARDLQVQPGEQVVTSGLDGCFPPGHLLGYVKDLKRLDEMRWSLTVLPACDAAATEGLYVLTGAGPDVPWPEPANARTGGR